MTNTPFPPSSQPDDALVQERLRNAFQNTKKLSLTIKRDFPPERLKRDKLWFAEFLDLISGFILMQRDQEQFQVEETSRGRQMFAPGIDMPKAIEYAEAMMKAFYSLPQGLLPEEYMFFQFWPSIYNAYLAEAKAEQKKSGFLKRYLPFIFR